MELDILEILQKTITGTPEEIEETSNFLNEQQGNPEYISCLIEIISNLDVEENLRLAAAIQLKLQVRNDFDLEIDFSTICTLIEISPIRVQLQLQLILYDFVQKRVDSEEIEQVISTCDEFIQTDLNHAAVSVLILRFLIKLRYKYKNYEFINDFIPDIEQFFEPISNMVLSILEDEDISQYLLFIHSSLHMASKYLEKTGSLPAIESWAEIITQIINQPAYQSPPYLDKDAIKLACYLYPSLSPEDNASLLLSIATHSINGAAFMTTAMSFKYIKLGLISDDIWPMIEKQQFDLVGGLFFRTFILSQQDISDINDNLYNFISTTQVSFFDYKTPRNGAMPSFLAAVDHHPTLAHCAIQIVRYELESFRESCSNPDIDDIGRAYGALQFAGIALQKVPEPLAQKYANLIYEISSSMLDIDNFIYTAGFFQFIGLKAEESAFDDVEVLFKCFDTIISYDIEDSEPESDQDSNSIYIENPERDLVQYFASYAAANMLENFIADRDIWTQIREEVINNGSIEPLLSNVLRICKIYATNKSAAAIRYFTDFFVEDIAPVATEYVSELFNIFLQYASEPHHYADISITNCQCQIPKVCRIIREQRSDVPPSYFSEALDRIEEVTSECDPQIYEDVLNLMACFIECMTEISEPFIKVPQVLLNVIERYDEEQSFEGSELELSDLNSPSKVKGNVNSNQLHPSLFIKVIKALIKINPDVVTSTPEMLLPIIDIVKYFLVQPSAKLPYDESSVLLFQLIFIKLKNFESVAEFAPLFLEIIDEINPSSVDDVVAALVYFDPELTLVNEKNYERWMSSHPPAFLMGALSVIDSWDSLHEQIKQLKDQIITKIEENIESLNEHLQNLNEHLQVVNEHLQNDECDEGRDIFNFPEILEAFSEINFE